jgi:tetratricopeptide (TPR) repeat protein
LFAGAITGRAQTSVIDGNFTLALPNHQGQLKWNAEGFKIVQSSAKPNGAEVGIRANDGSGQFTLLGFLFLFPEQVPMTSAKCRDGVLEPAKKSNPTLQIAASTQMARSDGLPMELVSYVGQGKDGKLVYSIRGFLAIGDICGDLEIYGNDVKVISDPNLKKIWNSYRFDPSYSPQFNDVSLYAEILYQNHMYQAAGPVFEQALTKLKDDKNKDQLRWQRVTTDQAGMAYGLAGNIPKARAIFEAGIAKDPEYPMYYYNLACADAEEKRLTDARNHLQQAFARKANVIPSETMPDPTKDDSFLPYRDNKEFWTFVESLR